MTKTEAIKALNSACMRLFGCNMTEATDKQAYKALCTVVRNEMYDRRRAYKRSYKAQERKQVYYMSMEFLVGTSLRNNLYNLGQEKVFTDALKDLDIDIQELYQLDPDAGLGNGGLGRLASCYMDSLTGLGYPATGFSIRYEFGIFKQQIVDGWQMELPDNWLQMGDVWLVPKEDDAVEVRFGGEV
ncbi:MAG: glycogen/starch/alpha-glucan phosphorylase, partial [Oscillospiraceae bacterium]|nr:glycogen/starch/alpha-glucan phosphorylase [Oscillospiraceae bacterium]